MAPGDGFFSTQRTVIWIFHGMNLHVAFSVVCGCVLFAIYIPNINLITMNNMSLRYIFHVAFHVTIFTTFLVLQAFFLTNLTAIIKMVMFEVLTAVSTPFIFFVVVALITIKLQILHRQSENRNVRNGDCIPQFFSVFSIYSRFSFFY